MTNADILDYISTLIEEDITQLMNEIEMSLLNGAVVANSIKEARFKGGIKCPVCGSKAVKNGKVAGKQRYLCLNDTCKKSFGDFTGCILSGTHLPMRTWMHFAKCTVLGMTLPQIHMELGVSVKTAFYMRHKLFAAIESATPVHILKERVEIDETYFRDSYKGNHNTFKLPRAPRTGFAKFRGLSPEQICVAFAVDSSKKIIAAPICDGMPNNKELGEFYVKRIAPGSTVFSDSLQAYRKAFMGAKINRIAIKAGSWKNGSNHLKHIDNMHSDCKRRLNHIHNGVSTKFLNRYLQWFIWMHENTGRRLESQEKDLFRYSSLVPNSTKMRELDAMSRFITPLVATI